MKDVRLFASSDREIQRIDDARFHHFVQGHQRQPVKDLIEHTSVNPIVRPCSHSALNLGLNVAKHRVVTLFLHPLITPLTVVEATKEFVLFCAMVLVVKALSLAAMLALFLWFTSLARTTGQLVPVVITGHVASS